VIEGVVWSEQTLTQLEGHDWGEPTFPSYVVTNGHRLRYKPLKEFTAEDLRFMLGQQISLPILMPMALDVLELDAGGESTRGTLLYNALKVDKHFWREHPRLWHRMNVVLGELHLFLDFIEQEVLPAAAEFKAARPG
jgi:hypothetical protein